MQIKQFNATSKQQADQFMANLANNISQFNATQTNSMNQFMQVNQMLWLNLMHS